MQARKAAHSKSIPFVLAWALVYPLVLPLGAFAAKKPVDPECAALLDVESGKILSEFVEFQNPTTYTPAKARVMQARVEKYLGEIGTQLKNFNVERFVEDGLDSLPQIDRLSKVDRAKLVEVLAPAFTARRVPELKDLRLNLRRAGLSELPSMKIRKVMDISFRIWRTKLIFDTMGEAVYNQLAKAFAKKLKIGEFSMEIGLLGRKAWEAFFEGEKGPAIFNPSVGGTLKDSFLAIEAHESVHMIVQTLASQGRPSPYHSWIFILKKYKKFGAIGKRQRDNLFTFRDDPRGAGDFYRAEDLFIDEIPAHIVEASYLDIRMSKILQREYREYLDDILPAGTAVTAKEDLRDELEDLYSDYLRLGAKAVEWDEYSQAARKKFDAFLDRDPSDLGRTGIGNMTRGLGDYMNWIDIINNNIQVAMIEARRVLEGLVEEAKAAGRRGIHPVEDGPILIRDDVFLGKKGYLVEVKIPIDVLQSDNTWRRQEAGAAVRFRFTQQGESSKNITPKKLEKVFTQLDWILELNREVGKQLGLYAKMLKEGRLKSPTVRDILMLKQEQTDLREIVRKTMGEIRDGR